MAADNDGDDEDGDEALSPERFITCRALFFPPKSWVRGAAAPGRAQHQSCCIGISSKEFFARFGIVRNHGGSVIMRSALTKMDEAFWTTPAAYSPADGEMSASSSSSSSSGAAGGGVRAAFPFGWAFALPFALGAGAGAGAPPRAASAASILVM